MKPLKNQGKKKPWLLRFHLAMTKGIDQFRGNSGT